MTEVPESSTQIKLYIVIATHDRNDLLRRTIESIISTEIPGEFKEMIVVENGGQFGAREVVSSFVDRINISYVYEQEGNKSIALNKVMASINELGNNLIYFSDDDVRVGADTLSRYVTQAQSDQTVGRRCFYFGPCRVDYESPPPEWLFRYLPVSARGFNSADLNPRAVHKHVIGFNWAAFQHDIITIGGFDPDFGPGSASGARGQETNAVERLMAKKVSCQFVDDAWVWHYVNRDRCSPEWALDRLYKNGLRYGLVRNRDYIYFLFNLILLALWSVMALALRFTTVKAHYYFNARRHFRLGVCKGYFN